MQHGRLADGRLSFIVSPGAWTSLVGKLLARQMCVRAQQAGYMPHEKKLTTPLRVAGVGNGTQCCNYQITCPGAVPTSDNGATLHHLSAPIVEGTGETLPGLLGLRTLENLRAILDVDRRMMHLPGPGDVQIILPLVRGQYLWRKPLRATW